MKLSIIIVNYRSWGHLQTALDTLKPGFPDDWEIIVIDNESQTDSLQGFAAKYPWVKFIANVSNSGFGFAANIGARQAIGSELLFMNPDVVASCDDINGLIAENEKHPDVSLLAPRQVDEAGRPQKIFDEFPNLWNQIKILRAIVRFLFPARFPDPRAQHESLTYCDWVTGSFLLVSHEDFDDIGGWSPDYWMYAEDVDLCRRAANKGMRVAFTPHVQVVHAHGGSSRINIDVKAMTKLEVIISKHVYANNHFRGIRQWLMHDLIGLIRLPLLMVAALLDLLTLMQIPALRVRSKMLAGLLKYYAGVVKSGSWLSPKAIANRTD